MMMIAAIQIDLIVNLINNNQNLVLNFEKSLIDEIWKNLSLFNKDKMKLLNLNLNKTLA